MAGGCCGGSKTKEQKGGAILEAAYGIAHSIMLEASKASSRISSLFPNANDEQNTFEQANVLVQKAKVAVALILSKNVLPHAISNVIKDSFTTLLTKTDRIIEKDFLQTLEEKGESIPLITGIRVRTQVNANNEIDTKRDPLPTTRAKSSVLTFDTIVKDLSNVYIILQALHEEAKLKLYYDTTANAIKEVKAASDFIKKATDTGPGINSRILIAGNAKLEEELDAKKKEVTQERRNSQAALRRISIARIQAVLDTSKKVETEQKRKKEEEEKAEQQRKEEAVAEQQRKDTVERQRVERINAM